MASVHATAIVDPAAELAGSVIVGPYAVIGAGVIGLAVARALAAQGREVLILEAENAFGTGISARNSEAIATPFASSAP